MKTRILAAYAAALLLLSGCASQTDTDGTIRSAPDTTAAPAESAAPGTTSAETPETETPPVKSSYQVGDTIQTDDLTIVYMSSGDYISDNQFIQPQEGNKYIFIKLYCENTGTSDANISWMDFECYADGYACSGIYFDDALLSATLSPGRSATGIVTFEVPEDAGEIQIEYETNVWTEDKILFDYEGVQDSGFTPEINDTASADAVQVGQSFTTDDLIITYVSCGTYESDNIFITPKDGYHYIYCEFEVENISDSDQYLSYYDFDCFADGASCDGFYGMDTDLSATLSPGRKVKGTVAFEVPEDAGNIEVEFLANLWTSERVIFAYQP